jgi:purine-binding chemotaxis protein CheW
MRASSWLAEYGVDATKEFLILRAGGRVCAVNLADVEETMRPLPVEPLPAMPPFLRGCAVIRGGPVPVLDLGVLVGSPDVVPPTRFVTVRAASRRIALSVDAVCGTRPLNPSLLDGMPALLQGARAGFIESVGSLDQQLLLLLQAARLVSDDLWAAIDAPLAVTSAPAPAPEEPS